MFRYKRLECYINLFYSGMPQARYEYSYIKMLLIYRPFALTGQVTSFL